MIGQETWRGRAAALALGVLALALGSSGPAAASHTARPTGGALRPAALAAPRGPLQLAGITSQDLPIVLRFSRNGRALTRALTALHLRCTSGDELVIPDDFRRLPVSPTGRFATRYRLPPSAPQDNTTVALSGFIRGRLSGTRRTARGSWSATLVFRDATTGTVSDTCSSGTVRFRVTR
jgi:hypothetical protein